jgi:hypothetical protein
MRRLADTVLVIGTLVCLRAPVHAQRPQAMPRPQLPVFDWNACPREYCAYRQWTALQPVTLYDTWAAKRRPAGNLAVGEKVLAVTGVVITFKPGIIRLDRDYKPKYPDPEVPDLRRGDILLTYTDRGEFDSVVWFKGKYYPHFSIRFARWPDGRTGCIRGDECAGTYVDLGRKEWWAKVKLTSGRTAWVNMDSSNFKGIGDR